MPRKPPVRHKVRSHISDGKVVKEYQRGSGRFQSKSRSSRVVGNQWILPNVNPILLELYGAPNDPLFILDEMLPQYLEDEILKGGYVTIHVKRIFKEGTPDRAITTYAEQHNAHVLTKDIMSFPEPKYGGDRIAIADVPGREIIKETWKRLSQLGYPPRSGKR